MKLFRTSDLRIGTKLAGGFFIIVVLTLALGALSLVQLSRMHAQTQDLAEHLMPSVAHAGELRVLINRMRRAEAGLVSAHNSGEVAGLVKQIAERAKDIAQVEAQLKPLFKNAQETAGFEHYGQQKAAYFKVQADLTEIAQGIDFTTAELVEMTSRALAVLYAGDSEQAFADVADALGKVSQAAGAAAASAQARAETVFGNARLAVLGALVLVVFLAALFAFLIARGVSRPAGQAVAAARAMAAGNLAEPIPVGGRDEMGQLLAALTEMRAKLAHAVAGVRGGAEGVAAASAQIESGNHDLSARTERQASALEETAASMEELGSTVRQNADSAQQANQLALSASATAAQGGDVVAQVVQAMQGISMSSSKIADIIGVIDGIAFQTNILALNAAVEAARAGEQGRGFAVVASEVRSLAGRSADAAKEIKALIGASATQVQQGTEWADKAGATMSQVVSSIRRVTDMVGKISAASSEQSEGVDQVGEAVQQMDSTTQQNAALVEQMAAAATSLKSQAGELVQAVAVFRLAPDADGEHSVAIAQKRVSSVRHSALPATALPVRPPSGALPQVGRRVLAEPAARPPHAASASAPAVSGTARGRSMAPGDDWEAFK